MQKEGSEKLSTIMFAMFSTCCELPEVPENADSMFSKSSVSEIISLGCCWMLVLK